MAAFFALIVFYIGSANAVLAVVAGTYTQSRAGRLKARMQGFFP